MALMLSLAAAFSLALLGVRADYEVPAGALDLGHDVAKTWVPVYAGWALVALIMRAGYPFRAAAGSDAAQATSGLSRLMRAYELLKLEVSGLRKEQGLGAAGGGGLSDAERATLVTDIKTAVRASAGEQLLEDLRQEAVSAHEDLARHDFVETHRSATMSRLERQVVEVKRNGTLSLLLGDGAGGGRHDDPRVVSRHD